MYNSGEGDFLAVSPQSSYQDFFVISYDDVMANRTRKRAIIIAIYLLILIGIVWMIASALRPAPSCTDGKQNQNEAGVDCGGVCGACAERTEASPISVVSSAVLPGTDGRLDAVARIANPNPRFGSADVAYTFILRAADGSTVAERTGRTYILPSETKYVVEQNIVVPAGSQRVTTATLTVSGGTTWQRFEGFEEPRITVTNKRFDLVAGGTAFAEAYALVRNESPYDFANLLINVVVKDAAGTPIALQKTEMDALNASMQRDFKLQWPQRFEGAPISFDVEVEANVFDVANFRKRYLPGGELQQWQ